VVHKVVLFYSYAKLCPVLYIIRESLIALSALAQLIGHWATGRKATGSIPDSCIETFHCHHPAGRTVALGSTQSLTVISTRNMFFGVKAAGA
jgi:hypothetical protein